MISMEWLVPCVTAVGTVILIPLINLYFKSRSDAKAETLAAKEQEKKDFRDEYLNIVVDLRAENQRLSIELKSAISRIAHLESMCDNEAPYPAWSVGLAGEYRWVNRAFESQILDPLGMNLASLIGKTASEVWSPEVSVQLQKLGPQPGFSFDKKLLGTRFLFQHKLLQGTQPVGVSGIAPPE